jgi:hypothetical protein
MLALRSFVDLSELLKFQLSHLFNVKNKLTYLKLFTCLFLQLHDLMYVDCLAKYLTNGNENNSTIIQNKQLNRPLFYFTL